MLEAKSRIRSTDQSVNLLIRFVSWNSFIIIFGLRRVSNRLLPSRASQADVRPQDSAGRLQHPNSRKVAAKMTPALRSRTRSNSACIYAVTAATKQSERHRGDERQPNGRLVKPDVPAFVDSGVRTPVFNEDGCPVNLAFDGDIAPKFFKVGSYWGCYRRNYFQVSVGLKESLAGRTLFLQNRQKLECLAFQISAVLANDATQPIELVQHTPKRDKGPQKEPELQILTCNQSVRWDRLQFKIATSNNGKKRGQQQFLLKLSLKGLCILSETKKVWVDLSEHFSEPLIVRGRSPGHYNDNYQSCENDSDDESLSVDMNSKCHTHESRNRTKPSRCPLDVQVTRTKEPVKLECRMTPRSPAADSAPRHDCPSDNGHDPLLNLIRAAHWPIAVQHIPEHRSASIASYSTHPATIGHSTSEFDAALLLASLSSDEQRHSNGAKQES